MNVAIGGHKDSWNTKLMLALESYKLSMRTLYLSFTKRSIYVHKGRPDSDITSDPNISDCRDG